MSHLLCPSSLARFKESTCIACSVLRYLPLSSGTIAYLFSFRSRQSVNSSDLVESRLSTPTVNSRSSSRSLSPAPVLPARVVALRGPTSTGSNRRKSAGSTLDRSSSTGRRKRARDSDPLPSTDHLISVEDREVDENGQELFELFPKKRSRHRKLPPLLPKEPEAFTDADEVTILVEQVETDPTDILVPPSVSPEPVATLTDIQVRSRTAPVHREPFIPPQTLSGQPCLLEAANRRLSAQVETDLSKLRVAQQKSGEVPKKGRLVAREKTRVSRRLMEGVKGFGMGVPGVVEWKSEVCLFLPSD